MKKKFTSIELCAGAGGQALGLEQAGYEHIALVENDPAACRTLRQNRPRWNVLETDIREFDASRYRGVDLVAGGVPCQPFSIGGKQLGAKDERDLFPEALRVIEECKPRLILLENVRGLSDRKFEPYRRNILRLLRQQGYYCEWQIVNAAHLGVPQNRMRYILVGRRKGYAPYPWPKQIKVAPTVADTIADLMRVNGWKGVKEWSAQALGVAPCLVGGSKKHGGPDLGPQRAKREWASMGVDGNGLANEAPAKEFEGFPKLTVRMTARLQGFPDNWEFVGGKTATYRQVGNAFPPPVAKALGLGLIDWMQMPSRKNMPEFYGADQLELSLAQAG